MAVDDLYTKSLLHFDGSDASVTFTDGSGKVWTPTGTAQIDTAAKKFGTGSGIFDGDSDSISTPAHADFNTGTGAWTIDFWVSTTLGNTATGCLVHQNTGSDISYDLSITYRVLYWNIKSGEAIQGTTLMNDGAWRHVALVRNGDVFKMYVNGTSEGGSVTATGYSTVVCTDLFRIGVSAGSGQALTNYFPGQIDEFRFSKGIARWTTTFTSPTVAYEDVYGFPTENYPRTILIR